MSYVFRTIMNEQDNLIKLKPKALDVRMEQITQQNSVIGSQEHQQHENNEGILESMRKTCKNTMRPVCYV